MFTLIGITGASGSGKTTSLRNLDPDSTWIASRIRKALPFPQSKWVLNKNVYELRSTQSVVKVIQAAAANTKVKTLVMDDWQYIAAYELFDRLEDKGYDKWTQLAGLQANLIRLLESNMRPDQIAVLINHDDLVDTGNGQMRRKIKTQGKMVDDKFTPEGLLTIHLFTDIILDENKTRQYVFRVKPTATDISKVPLGMYEPSVQTVPNDLAAVIERYQQWANS